MSPENAGVRLHDDAGTDLGLVAYGERVYINGRVMSFTKGTTSD